MLNRHVIGALVALFAFGLVACGAEAEPTEVDTSDAAVSPATHVDDEPHLMAAVHLRSHHRERLQSHHLILGQHRRRERSGEHDAARAIVDPVIRVSRQLPALKLESRVPLTSNDLHPLTALKDLLVREVVQATAGRAKLVMPASQARGVLAHEALEAGLVARGEREIQLQERPVERPVIANQSQPSEVRSNVADGELRAVSAGVDLSFLNLRFQAAEVEAVQSTTIDFSADIDGTLLADVENRMEIAQEEIFAPVLVAIPYDGEDDAVRIANDSRYGLGGGVWTPDLERGANVASRIRTGCVTVNHGILLDFRSPFGGFKQSGLGRELGPEGLEAYTEYQTVIFPAG